MYPPDPEPRVTRLERLGPRGLRVRIHLEGHDPLEIALESVEAARLGVGDIVGPDRRALLLESDADVRARDAALHLLAHRARTASELRRRLRQKGFEPERVDRCLERLSDRGLIDDAAVAAAFVRDRLRHRPRGARRLGAELRAKGVGADVATRVIGDVFEEEEVDDIALALEVAASWVERQGPALLDALAASGRSPERERAHRRLGSYLARRGFGGDALRAAVAHAVTCAQQRP